MDHLRPMFYAWVIGTLSSFTIFLGELAYSRVVRMMLGSTEEYQDIELSKMKQYSNKPKAATVRNKGLPPTYEDVLQGHQGWPPKYKEALPPLPSRLSRCDRPPPRPLAPKPRSHVVVT